MGKRAFKVELAGKDTIVLRAIEDKRLLVEKVAAIQLVGDREKAFVDAATVKDFHRRIKH